MDRFEIQPVLRSALPEVAEFLYKWRNTQADAPQKPIDESVLSLERRLRWLLIDNPVAGTDSEPGNCVRDHHGVIRGLSLCFPVAFQSAGKQLLGLCSGSYFVDAPARSLGFYLFKKYLRTQGYAFYFASTCNINSSELWKSMGGCPVPHSETEYILPLRLDVVLPAFVAGKTSSPVAARMARMCGLGANPILRLLTRSSSGLKIELCQDWDKLAELSRRHQSPDHITSDRSAAFLQWRYGPGSPSHPTNIYLFRDEQGNEGWFALGDLSRGQAGQFRESVLLDVIWPREHMKHERIFAEIARLATASSDVIYFRWQPGIDYRAYSRCVIPHKLGAPRAYVTFPKGAPRFPLHSFDYDDSEYIAWRFQWTNA